MTAVSFPIVTPVAQPVSLLDDRGRTGRLVAGLGVAGLVAAVVVGVGGWLLAARVTRSLEATISPIAGTVLDVAESIEATEVMVVRTIEAIESIETTTRSTGRALASMSDILGETGDLAGGGIADSIESAVEAMPSLVATGRVVERTMSALSFLGVDYDPDIPLDRALADLERSLAPIPGQIRDQVALMETVEEEVARIGEDAGGLAAVLLQARIDLMEVERVVGSAADNADATADSVADIEAEITTYDTLVGLMAVAAAIALAAAATATMLVGLHMARSIERPGTNVSLAGVRPTDHE